MLADGDGEQIIIGHKLSEANVVRNECGHDADCATCLAKGSVAREVGDGKEYESDREAEEEDTQADRLAESGDEEEEGDDSPSNEVDSDGRNDLGGVGRGSIGFTDARAGDQKRRKREPERAVGSECGSTKSIASGEFPHTSKELGETTAEESHADDNVGCVDTTSIDIVQRQDESRRCEGEETKWAGVAELGARASNGVVNVGSFDVRHFGRHFLRKC